MTYTEVAPTLAQLEVMLADDIRDAGTFDETDLIRLINDGIVEINRVYPLHVVDTIALAQGTTYYGTRFSDIYRVEVWSGSDFVGLIPSGDGNGPYTGWNLYTRTLYIPPNLVGTEMFAAYENLSMQVAGYAKRQLGDVATKTDPLELDPEAALGVRWFAQYRAFQMLMSDRSLYKQWQGQSNNSDVSMPMLLNLVQTASQMWERHRRTLVTYRRSPVGDPVVL